MFFISWEQKFWFFIHTGSTHLRTSIVHSWGLVGLNTAVCGCSNPLHRSGARQGANQACASDYWTTIPPQHTGAAAWSFPAIMPTCSLHRPVRGVVHITLAESESVTAACVLGSAIYGAALFITRPLCHAHPANTSVRLESLMVFLFRVNPNGGWWSVFLHCFYGEGEGWR